MSNATHTPGPWSLKHVGGSNFAVQQFDIRAGGFPVFNKSARAIDGGLIYVSPGDASLIAAAPELLEALEALLHEAWNNMSGGAGHILDDARAAIAKAKGGAA